MNFFESQDRAKRNTGRLIALFAMAVLSLIMITNFLVMIALGLFTSGVDESLALSGQFRWEIFGLIGVGVIAIVLFGSLYKMAALAGGGARVAEMLDGRLLLPDNRDFHERRVLNVVEEMALASGTPVPPVYLLEESGINAFAAGYAPADAVIGVTRGAITALGRDELQGVIAHEFSHILYGDMRINIRLIAVLHGILILGIVGYHLLRGGSYRRRSKQSGGILALGLGLVVIGYVGTFFGNLIKAAVSRQREYLADSSAVQYTRNPEGIGNALMRIASHDKGSFLDNPSSMEISHALFEEGKSSWFRGLFATHPPIEDRIRAVLPNWDGSYSLPPVSDFRATQAVPLTDKSSADQQRGWAEALLGTVTGAAIADAMIAGVGQTTPTQLQQAQDTVEAMPRECSEAAHQPASARALIYALVLDKNVTTREGQMVFLKQTADFGVYETLEQLLPEAEAMNIEFRLPLLGIATGSMRQLSPQQYQLFKTNLMTLIGMDSKVSLFEWALQRIVLQRLDAVFEKRAPRRIGRRSLVGLEKECSLLISVIALAGGGSNLAVRKSFETAQDHIRDVKLVQLDVQDINLAALNSALDKLADIKPLQKPMLLKACAACITADRKVTAVELEIFRAIADTLDCPMPPLALANNSSR